MRIVIEMRSLNGSDGPIDGILNLKKLDGWIEMAQACVQPIETHALPSDINCYPSNTSLDFELVCYFHRVSGCVDIPKVKSLVGKTVGLKDVRQRCGEVFRDLSGDTFKNKLFMIKSVSCDFGDVFNSHGSLLG